MVGTGTMAGRALLLAGVAALAACDCYSSEERPEDAGADASVDAATLTDAGADASTDASTDAGMDAGVDAAPEEDCPEGPPRLQAAQDVETWQEGCWSLTRFGPSGSDRSSDGAELVVSGDGTVHIADNPSHSGDVKATVSLRHLTNAGGFWQREILDCAEVSSGYQPGSSMVVTSAGALYLSANFVSSIDDGSFYAGEGRYLASNVDGPWWTERLDVFGPYDVRIALAPEDRLAAVGSSPDQLDRDLLFGRREASGRWATEALPPTGPWGGTLVELAVRGDGAAYVLSVDFCPGGPEEHERCTLEDEGPGYAVLELASNESGAWVVEPVADDLHLGLSNVALAVGPGDDVHCVYPSADEDHGPATPVHGVRREGEWSFEPIDESATGSEHVAMAVDGDGAVHVIYARTNPEHLVYATNRTGVWVLETMPTPGYRTEPNIVVGSDGLIHIAASLGTLFYGTRTCP